MENSNQYTAEELQKCPYHNPQMTASTDEPRENANTGDWDNLDNDNEDRTNPDRNEEGGNDNSGGAGSSGSAATNN